MEKIRNNKGTVSHPFEFCSSKTENTGMNKLYAVSKKMRTVISKFAIILIKIYQAAVSPLFGKTCRFHPSCSEYTIQSINKRGILKGVYAGLKRIIRCNPLNPGGYDPVL